DLALQDWMGTAGFDREDDLWPRKWAEAYVAFAAGEKRGWLRAMGHRIFPVVGWAERGGYDAMGHGNSVPRFHVTWGTGPGIVEPFERRAREAVASGRLTFKFRHRADPLGRLLPAHVFPGADTLGQLQYIKPTGYDYSWVVLTQSIIKKEFALSGSEQNPDLTGKSWLMTVQRATHKGAPGPVEAFKAKGVDFVVRDNLADLVAGMN